NARTGLSRRSPARIGNRLTGMTSLPIAGEQPFGGSENLCGQKRRHAAMVERACSQLAGAARHFFLQVDCPGVIGFRPANVVGTEQRDDWPAECGREMSRPTVGGDEQVTTADTRF